MSKKERLLRIAGLIIILRDELEEQGKHSEWCEVATNYIEGLCSVNPDEQQEVNQQFEQVYTHIDNCINEVFKPCDVIGELFCILRKDMKQLGITHAILEASDVVWDAADVSKIKLLDSKIRLV